MRVRGWVYVISNQAMPGMVKVGFSTKDPTLRAKELGNTGSPHPYQVVYDALIEDPRGLEQRVHAELDHWREGKEWFRCDARHAVETIRRVAGPLLLERALQSDLGPGTAEGTSALAPACQYSDCKLPVARTYKGKDYCAVHYEVERRGRFHVARYLARKA